MKPPFDLVVDLDTPVSAFLKLAPLSPRYLLESVEGGERVGRWSFLGFGDDPLEVRLDRHGWRVGREVGPAPDSRDALLAALRAAIAQAPRPGPVDDRVPFHGGLVGALSYDIVRRLEGHIGSRAPAIDEPEIALVATRSVLVFDHATRRAALLHDGSAEEREVLRARIRGLLAGPVPPQPAGPFHVGEAVPSLSRDAFLDVVRTLQEHIAAGDVYQIVPSISFGMATDVPPFLAYRALRLLNPSPYMTYLDLGDVTVVGGSPEALVSLDGRRATLRPIAGTRPRSEDPVEDVRLEEELLADPKEASEHVMLVDLARNDVGRVSIPGTVTVAPYRTIERYSHVMHIVSGVQGVLRPEVDALDLLAATFPAGTVVGAPKIKAMDLLDAHEPIRRGLYAGTHGYLGHDGRLDQAIAIRSLVFRDGACRVQAGAGVVADSVPEKEHDEVVAKAAALRAALAFAAEGRV